MIRHMVVADLSAVRRCAEAACAIYIERIGTKPSPMIVDFATMPLAPPARAAKHVVEIRDFAFVPAEIVVRPGDSVTWINRDIVVHTATAIDRSWDTGEIPSGGQKTLRLTTNLKRKYLCIYHPAMRGNLSITQ